MTPESITLVSQGIHNPAEPRHYMRLKPVAGRVRILAAGRALAESSRAMRMLEVGKDLYDPVIYVPRDDVLAPLAAVPDRSTHCPLKGDASYFRLEGDDDPIAWTYDRPLPFASMLDGLVAFYPDRVVVEETGSRATI
jgi:uncharacterized protein (DUF427 family)